jgi:hypothetical protein
MKPMEDSTTGRANAQEDTTSRTTERGPGTPHYARHFQSLILPDLVSADALVPAWLRKRLKRADTPVSR